MKEPNNLQEGLALFEHDFQLEKSYLNLDADVTIGYEEAFILIMRVVEELLAKDFTRLINCLYRLDVLEDKLKIALSESNKNPASVITEMIIEREIQKAETRKRHKP